MKIYLGLEHYDNGELYEDQFDYDELLFVSDSLDEIKKNLDEYIEYEQREETQDTDEGELYSVKEVSVDDKYLPCFTGICKNFREPNMYRAFKCTEDGEDTEASYVYYIVERELILKEDLDERIF